ncbi:GntR family transcriptional regulator [Propionibacteriaceae bacterium Y2011]|uniref:GntR family transcriptional regulator n=1 Tax=Microlunatus sp. Y2014 TaxID=3418488 RepID=UPI003B4E1645
MDELNEIGPLRAQGSLAESIRDSLRDAINRGVLPPGYRLREIPLADHFECSTTPVREAIRRLAGEGLVRLNPRRGAEVITFDQQQIANLFEVRSLLECAAVRRAAQRRPDADDLAEVTALVAKQSGQLADGAVERRVDVQVHRAIATLSGNPELTELVTRVNQQIDSVRARARTEVPGGPEHAVAAHQALLDAITSGDADQAEAVMAEHLTWSREAVLSTM